MEPATVAIIMLIVQKATWHIKYTKLKYNPFEGLTIYSKEIYKRPQIWWFSACRCLGSKCMAQ